MTETIYIKTNEILEEFLIQDIKSIINKEPKKIDNQFYELQIKFENIFETVYKLINLSRTIEKIYMKKINHTIGEYNFLRQIIKIKDKELEVYDLTGSILESRNYLIHENSDTLNFNLINYCFFKLEMNKKKKYCVIDIMSNYSEIIIESSTFNPRKPIYIKDRYEFQIYNQLKNTFKKFPDIKIEKDTNKYVSIVREDKAFKRSRENLSKSNQKIKISKQELEWIDLKFEEKAFDFVISFLPIFKDKENNHNFLKEFLLQAKYLCKNKICIITREEIDDYLFI
jgi:hypothetical protein